MIPFSYARASTTEEALQLLARDGSRLLGGGTNLVDLMRKGVEGPAALVDVTALSDTIEETEQGGLLIGAAARNSAVAAHPLVRTRFPFLARAVLAGASAQIRNMATVGGNLMQRTRCVYFADVNGSRCNKRSPGSGCDAVGGFSRYHAILGASSACIATHPSDMCVALAALDTTVHLSGPNGSRMVAFADFHLLPGDHPDLETVMMPGEVITAIEIAPLPGTSRSTYRKVRDRASYAFALVSIAAAVAMRDGRIADVRLGFGGVAPKPWRAVKAEAVLLGAPATPEIFAAAAAAELADAAPLDDNAFKVELMRRTMTAVLADLTGGSR